MPDDFETMMIEHALDVAPCAGEIIIDTDDIGALLEQTLAQMRAEKSGAASDQHTRFQMQCGTSFSQDEFNPAIQDRPSHPDIAMG